MSTGLQYPLLDSAIINAEGNSSNNNPFDIMSGGSKVSYPTMDVGIQAGDQLLQNAASGMSQYYSPSETLSQFGNTYSGGDPNWAKNVGNYLGVPSSTPMSDIFAQTSANQNDPTNPNATSSDSWYTPFLNVLQNQFTGSDFNLNPLGKPSGPWYAAWDPARWAIAIVGGGMVLIALLSFRTTGTIIEHSGRIVAKGAKLAA
jgi:hypothetical protein